MLSFINRVIRETHRSDLEYLDSNMTEATLCQNGFVEFLAQAYETESPIAFGPDVLWTVLLYQISDLVATDPNYYRTLFTHSSNKLTIRIATTNPTDLSTYIDRIIAQLIELVPARLASFFLPTLDSDHESTIARSAAFAGITKHYYTYQGNQGCQGPCREITKGIPKVRLLGRSDEWRTISHNWSVICDAFARLPERIPAFFARAQLILDKLASAPDQDFLRAIYQEENRGWIYDIVKQNPNAFAQVPYDMIIRGSNSMEESAVHFLLASGLFKRAFVEDFLTPSFGHAIFHVARKG